MTEEDIPERSKRPTQLVNDALEEMHRRRAEYRRARRMNSVTTHTQAAFQAAVVDVYDELRVYKSRVEDEWEKKKLDNIHVLDNQTVEERSVNTDGGAVNIETTRRPYRIPCGDLLTWSHHLDDVARELGFAAATRTKLADPADAIV